MFYKLLGMIAWKLGMKLLRKKLNVGPSSTGKAGRLLSGGVAFVLLLVVGGVIAFFKRGRPSEPQTF